MKLILKSSSLAVLTASMSVISCTTVSMIGKSSLAAVEKTAAATSSKITAFSDFTLSKIRPAGVKVVEVREKDLKKLPTGEERALAYESSRKKNFWFFGGPVDFHEPTLPQPGAEMDGSLLPPKHP